MRTRIKPCPAVVLLYITAVPGFCSSQHRTRILSTALPGLLASKFQLDTNICGSHRKNIHLEAKYPTSMKNMDIVG
jgi:hypothetical protein